MINSCKQPTNFQFEPRWYFSLLFFYGTHSFDLILTLFWLIQAEEQLKLVEEQRRMLEEKQRMEEEDRKRKKREQEVILNKKNARPKLSFSLGGK